MQNVKVRRSRNAAVEDRVLVGLAAAGDEEAFEGLFARHHGLVGAVASRILGYQEAQDASQEVWTLVWRAIGDFRGDSSFTTWLYRITFNTCMNALKKDERRKARDAASAATLPLVSPEDGPEARILAKERAGEARKKVLEALPRLREQHRAAFVLRYGEGLSYERVAEVLGVPRGTAKGWAHRGRRALRAATSPSLQGL